MIEPWGTLPKSQESDQTIEERVAEMIAEHEGDPEAHLGAGESIEVHRTQTMVDHPAGSIAVDKFSFTRLIMTSFESIDGLLSTITGSASITNQLGSVSLATGATSNSVAGLNAQTDGVSSFLSSKDAFWRMTLKLAQTTDQHIWFGLGYLIDEADFNGVGFKVHDGTLYVYMGDFDNYVETQISGVTLTGLHTYEIRYYASPQKVEFWIDGVLVHSYTTGYFPTDDDNFLGFLIRNTASASKYAYLYNFMYQQEY